MQNHFKEHPDGVIILEEPELGHPNILQLLMQILEGSFTAGDGSVLSTNGITIFILTNLGCCNTTAKVGFGTSNQDQQGLRVKESLEAFFTPALLSRLGWNNIFHLPPLSPSALRNIIRLAGHRYGEAEGVQVHIDDKLIGRMVEEENTVKYGARAVLDRYRCSVEPLMDEILCIESAVDIESLHVCFDETNKIVCHAVHRGSAGGPTERQSRSL